MSLWSSEDEAAGHFQRYKRKELEKKVEAAGFSLQYSNYFMSFLYLPILVVRVWMEKLGVLKRTEKRSVSESAKIAERQFINRNHLVDFVLKILQRFEMSRLKKPATIHFGSSIILVAKKRQ